jgi:hypothetical protein
MRSFLPCVACNKAGDITQIKSQATVCVARHYDMDVYEVVGIDSFTLLTPLIGTLFS